jgi:hypothetical protein
MREGGNASRLRDDFARSRKRWARSRHERRPVLPKQPIERIAPIHRITRRHEGVRQSRSSHAAPIRGLRAFDDAIDVDRAAKGMQPCADLTYSIDPYGSLAPQQRVEPGVCRVEEIPEHVNVEAVFDGGNFDPVYEPDPDGGRCPTCFVETCDRIVIGDADDRQAVTRGERHKSSGRQPAVRSGRVKVEIDHKRIRRWRGDAFCGRVFDLVADARRATGTRG